MDTLWTYLEDNELTVDFSNCPSNLKCSLCKNVMKKPMCTKCGCAFCNSCIHQYLSDEDKLCPECAKDDLNVTINCGSDLVEDLRANKEILNLIVTCPWDGCTEQLKMRFLEEHLLNCRLKKTVCIFHSMGCLVNSLNSGEMDCHLDGDKKRHLELIIDGMSAVKNDIESIKLQINSVFEKNKKIQSDNSEIKSKLNSLKDQLKNEKEKNNLKTFNETINQLKVEVINLKNKVYGTKEPKPVKANVNIKTGIPKEEIQTKTDVKKNPKKQDSRTSSPVSSVSVGFYSPPNLSKPLAGATNQVHPVATATLGQMQVSMTHAQWHVTDICKRAGIERFSDPFFVCGYCFKIRLVWHSNNNKLSSLVYLVRSEDDIHLEWPMPLTLRYSLIDPITKASAGSHDFSRATAKVTTCFEKPSREMVGLSDSVTYITLGSQPCLTQTDSFVIKVEAVN